MFGIPLYSKIVLRWDLISDLCFKCVPFICLAIDIWYSYLKRRGPIRLIYAILCKLCVLLLVFLIGLYGEDTLYSYCIYVLRIRIVFSSIFHCNPDCVYIAYLSGAYNANLFLYSVLFIAFCYILYVLYHVDIGNVLCVYFLLVVDHSSSCVTMRSRKFKPFQQRCVECSTVVTVK